MTSVVAPKTNMFALIGFIAAFVIPVVGIVLGVIASRQIGMTRESGRGLARWTIVGGVGSLLQVSFFTVWCVLFFGAIFAPR